MICEVCKFESDNIDEVTGYNSFGEAYGELEYEGYNCDIEECSVILCTECAENYKFKSRVSSEEIGKVIKEACLRNRRGRLNEV